MTDDTLKIRFDLDAAQVTSAPEIIEIAKSTFGNIEDYADHIIAFAEYKDIPITGELQELRKQTTQAKKEAEERNRRDSAQAIAEEQKQTLEEYQKNLSAGYSPDAPEMIEALSKVVKNIAGIGTAQGKRRIYTNADYLDECLNYDPSKDFTPDLFGGLAFPDGTTSYIGARTSRGKTTAMVNLASENIIATAPRKTIFITLEMSGKQITNKLILSTAFRLGIAQDDNHSIRRALITMNPGKDIYTVLKNKDFGRVDGEYEFRKYVNDAHNKIKSAQNSGFFILYDARGASLSEITNFITAQAENGTLVLLDYIQKMPPKDGTDTDSFRKVQTISYEVVNAAAKTNSVIIAGAQFNRMGGEDKLGDLFNDASFREAGDIEQDAHNAIGIGWKTDKQNRFYEVLKTREDKKQGTLYELDFDGGYSYMAQGEKTYRPEGNAGGNGTSGKGKEQNKTINSKKFCNLE